MRRRGWRGWVWIYAMSFAMSFGVYFWRTDRANYGVPLVALWIAMFIDGGPQRPPDRRQQSDERR